MKEASAWPSTTSLLGALCQCECQGHQLAVAGETRTGSRGLPGATLLSTTRRACACHPGTAIEPFSALCVILSLCPCSVGGLILDKTVSDPNFAGMAVFTPVINGEVLASAAGGKKRMGSEGQRGPLCQSKF